MLADARTLLLRQAGLLRWCALARGDASHKIALIDGTVDIAHPAFAGVRISIVGSSASVSAREHATFCASILVASEEDRNAGRALGICGTSSLLNLAAIEDDMLDGRAATGQVANTLARAVDLALSSGCEQIVCGVALKQTNSGAWQPLRDALLRALSARALVVFPAGNCVGAQCPASCSWPQPMIVGATDIRGERSAFSRHNMANNVVWAPGEDVPGALPGAHYLTRSGTSFAAAIVAGALALARRFYPGRSPSEITRLLFHAPDRILNCTAHS